ncbi:MAG: hypothetical protein ACM3ML_09900 [Micromonosporaceae bacterium]
MTALTAASLAGCGGTGAGVPSPRTGRQLADALRAWSSFPVSASPRPLVLSGPRVADPEGFPNGAAKLAYTQGAIHTPAALPSRPAAAAGFPLISSREAFGVFAATPAKGAPAVAPLTVTAVRIGTGVFQTDRGPRRLPAWLFGFRGIQDPAAVLAVAPVRVFSPPGHWAGALPFITRARLSPDGRTLTVEFAGAASGTGPCTADYHLRLADSRTAVAVVVQEHAHGCNGPCPAVAYRRDVTTVLSAPLGARVLVDAVSGTAVTVTPR